MSQIASTTSVAPVTTATARTTSATPISSEFIQRLADLLLQILPQLRDRVAENQVSQINSADTATSTTTSSTASAPVALAASDTPSEALPVSTASATPSNTTDTALPTPAAVLADANSVAAPPVPVSRPVADAAAPLVDGEARASTAATTELVNPTIRQQTTSADQEAAIAQSSANPLETLVARAD
ncbi:MAG: hypothetical protein WAQ53_02225 [Thiofilum sp.]|uniref:hypothetical protein n=1 Tax=Thiofilum sp. TaxID=2212733 RepID=UPI002600722D|nr:hypothetical protein [Thiofilum sp.]MBK8452996.1 hypothetical protein [Thiofilum sp.]